MEVEKSILLKAYEKAWSHLAEPNISELYRVRSETAMAKPNEEGGQSHFWGGFLSTWSVMESLFASYVSKDEINITSVAGLEVNLAIAYSYDLMTAKAETKQNIYTPESYFGPELVRFKADMCNFTVELQNNDIAFLNGFSFSPSPATVELLRKQSLKQAHQAPYYVDLMRELNRFESNRI